MNTDDRLWSESELPEEASGRRSGDLGLRVEQPRMKGRVSAGGVFFILIGGIVVAEIIAMIAVFFVRDRPYVQLVAMDAAIMAAIIFPLLYNLSFKPLLHRIEEQQQSRVILQARLRLMQYAETHSMDELLSFALAEIGTLTDSPAGSLHRLERKERRWTVVARSTDALEAMAGKNVEGVCCDEDSSITWAAAVRDRKPMLSPAGTGSVGAEVAAREGTPVSHEMVIPILRNNEVIATTTVCRRTRPYATKDVDRTATFADFAWDIVEQKRAVEALRLSEQKFRTIVDWTYDWELWLDPHAAVVYTSPSCERMTGYRPEAFMADPGLLIEVVHPDDRQQYLEHHRGIHEASADPMTIQYRVVARDGSIRWLEHVCRPLFETDGQYQGRRISNRDISQRKADERKINEQNRREAILTQAIQTIQADFARDLHDTLGQNIGFLRMNLEHLLETQSDHQLNGRAQIQSMITAADESYELIRAMLDVLQTDQASDPLHLFTRYALRVAERAALQIDVRSEGETAPLSPHQIRQLFYIFREALNNIERHAGATCVSVVFIWEEHGLTLMIADDGRGFDPTTRRGSDHYGLGFMLERANQVRGSLSVQSAPARGTTISILVPFEDELIAPGA